MKIDWRDVVVGDVAFFVDDGVPEFAVVFDDSICEKGFGLVDVEEVAFGEGADGEWDCEEW